MFFDADYIYMSVCITSECLLREFRFLFILYILWNRLFVWSLILSTFFFFNFYLRVDVIFTFFFVFFLLFFFFNLRGFSKLTNAYILPTHFIRENFDIFRVNFDGKLPIFIFYLPIEVAHFLKPLVRIKMNWLKHSLVCNRVIKSCKLFNYRRLQIV